MNSSTIFYCFSSYFDKKANIEPTTQFYIIQYLSIFFKYQHKKTAKKALFCMCWWINGGHFCIIQRKFVKLHNQNRPIKLPITVKCRYFGIYAFSARSRQRASEQRRQRPVFLRLCGFLGILACLHAQIAILRHLTAPENKSGFWK